MSESIVAILGVAGLISLGLALSMRAAGLANLEVLIEALWTVALLSHARCLSPGDDRRP